MFTVAADNYFLFIITVSMTMVLAASRNIKINNYFDS
jgi:hypothetical protein